MAAGGRRVGRAFAHPSSLRFLEFSVKVVRHRIGKTFCGRLWESARGVPAKSRTFFTSPVSHIGLVVSENSHYARTLCRWILSSMAWLQQLFGDLRLAEISLQTSLSPPTTSSPTSDRHLSANPTNGPLGFVSYGNCLRQDAPVQSFTIRLRGWLFLAAH